MLQKSKFFFVRLLKRIANFIYPTFYTKIAKFKFFIHDIKYQKGLYVDGRIIISPITGRVEIGKNFKIISRIDANLVGLQGPAIFQVIKTGKIKIGDNCGFSSPVLSSRSIIEIGNNVLLGGNVRIYDHDYHALDFKHRRRDVNAHSHIKSEKVVIKDDVFIGTNSIILKGVKIGARTIIGAGSIVALKNIPPDSFVAGNPAKIIKNKQEK